MKRKWTSPLLVSLTRGGPGEAVLSACKVLVSTGQPISSHGGCHQAPTTLCEERARTTRIASGTPICMECSDVVSS